MKFNFKVTVEDILKHPHFKDAKVVAGAEGLNRMVKWIHVIEVTQIKQFVNGNELVLCTGVGWKGEKKLAISFLKQLIERNVSALCIELGSYFPQIPEEMISLANYHQFPLIVFTKEVRFIDITRDLYEMFIESHYKMISNLESFSCELNQFLLSPNALEKILYHLHRFLNVKVIYLPLRGEPQFIPSLSPIEQKRILNQLSTVKNTASKSLSSNPTPITIKSDDTVISYKSIQAFDEKWADLVLISKERELTEFELLILDRAATAVAQELLRTLYIEEKKRQEESQWIHDWLSDKHQEKEIFQHLKTIEPSLNPSGCVVCLIKLELQTRQSRSFKNYQIMPMLIVARSIFEQNGFYPLTALDNNFLIYILLDKRNCVNWKSRAKKSVERLKHLMLKENMSIVKIIFGIGKIVKQLNNIGKSYQTAQEAIRIQEKTGNINQPLYDNLHIYRIISIADRHSDINEFILDYLHTVIEYDKQHKTELLQTLKIYLACRGSKKETSKKLFITRQALYHRIKKLEELLGPDFLYSEKRLAIEFALCALDYLK